MKNGLLNIQNGSFNNDILLKSKKNILNNKRKKKGYNLTKKRRKKDENNGLSKSKSLTLNNSPKLSFTFANTPKVSLTFSQSHLLSPINIGDEHALTQPLPSSVVNKQHINLNLFENDQNILDHSNIDIINKYLKQYQMDKDKMDNNQMITQENDEYVIRNVTDIDLLSRNTNNIADTTMMKKMKIIAKKLQLWRETQESLRIKYPDIKAIILVIDTKNGIVLGKRCLSMFKYLFLYIFFVYNCV